MEAPWVLLGVLSCFSLAVPTFQECKEEYRKQRPTHTACKPPNKNCTITKRNVSPEERLVILKTHNDYRSMVALGKLRGFPPAANMARLVWDEELASVAQALAEQCTSAEGDYDHDNWRDRFTTKFKATGQNLAYRGRNFPFSSTDWPGRIKGWFIEYEDYAPEQRHEFRPPPASKPMIGHFTQLVWAKTSCVGCGFVEYSVVGAVNVTHMQFYVCNYAVTGNVFKKPLYQEGSACSACPEETACDVTSGLCEKQESKMAKEESSPGKDGIDDAIKKSSTTTVITTVGKSDSGSNRHRSDSDKNVSNTVKEASGPGKEASNDIKTQSSTTKVISTAGKSDSGSTRHASDSDNKVSNTKENELSGADKGSAISNNNSGTIKMEPDPTVGQPTTEGKEAQNPAHLKDGSSWNSSNLNWQVALGAAAIALVTILNRYAVVA